MNAFLETVAANAILATVLAVVVFGITRFIKKPPVVYWLWMLVLLKLITPPLVDLPLTIKLLWTQTEIPTTESPAGEEPLYVPQPTISPTPPEISLIENFNSTPEIETEIAPLAILDDFDPLTISIGEEEQQHSTREFTIDEPAHSVAVIPLADSIASPRKAPVQWPWELILGSIWLAGTMSWFALAALRILRFECLIKYARPASDRLKQQARQLAGCFELKTCPEVLVVEDRVPPLLWSVRRPAVIVLPKKLLEELEPKDQEMLLAHELAHFRRRDHWFRWFEVAILGLYWWHPVVWWARKKLQQAEEQCCDAWVLWAFPEQAKNYAHVLLNTIDFLSIPRPALPAVASGMGQVRQVKRRFEMILKNDVSRRTSWPVRIGLCLFGTLALGFSARIIQADPQTLESAAIGENEPDIKETTLPEARSFLATLQEKNKKNPDSTATQTTLLPKDETTLKVVGELIKALNEDKQYKQRARKQKEIVDELSKLKVYVWQYEPTSLGKINRRLPASIREGFRKELGHDVFSSPSAISINRPISENDLQKVLDHLNTFPQLEKVSGLALNAELIGKVKAALPNVIIKDNPYIRLLTGVNAFGDPLVGTFVDFPGPTHKIVGSAAPPASFWQVATHKSRLSTAAKEKVIKALIEVLKDEDQYVREGAISSLLTIGPNSPEAISAFENLLTESNDSKIRNAAVKILAEVSNPSEKTIAALVFALKDKDDKVSGASLNSLLKSGSLSRKIVTALLEAVKSEDKILKKNAYYILGKIQPASDEVILLFATSLKDENPAIRRIAANALGRIRGTNQSRSPFSPSLDPAYGTPVRRR